MERRRIAEKTTGDQLRWKHTGGGILRLKDGRVIKPGGTFLASPNDVPMAFRDTIIPLESISTGPEPVAVKSAFSIQKKGKSNWYEVVDGQGKVVNEKALKKADALELVKKLEG
jgi:hypothetical protein